MTARPIIFSGPMVRALLDGTKTQTRRVIKATNVRIEDGLVLHDFEDGTYQLPCPYGEPGDRLWVRETWKPHVETSVHTAAIYRAEYVLSGGHQRGGRDGRRGRGYRPVDRSRRGFGRVVPYCIPLSLEQH